MDVASAGEIRRWNGGGYNQCLFHLGNDCGSSKSSPRQRRQPSTVCLASSDNRFLIFWTNANLAFQEGSRNARDHLRIKFHVDPSCSCWERAQSRSAVYSLIVWWWAKNRGSGEEKLIFFDDKISIFFLHSFFPEFLASRRVPRNGSGVFAQNLRGRKKSDKSKYGVFPI